MFMVTQNHLYPPRIFPTRIGAIIMRALNGRLITNVRLLYSIRSRILDFDRDDNYLLLQLERKLPRELIWKGEKHVGQIKMYLQKKMFL